MTNPSKAKGTAWESAVVAYLREMGWPYVERRALSGANDQGDIAGIPGVVVECKNAKTIALAAWVEEAKVEAENFGDYNVGVVWMKRRGKTNPGDGYVVMDGNTFVKLLKDAEWR